MVIFLTHMAGVWLLVRKRWRRVRWSNYLLGYYTRWGLKVLKVRVHTQGLIEIARVTKGLFVGNHLSYMDVLAIASHVPFCFVTSMEIKETPVLGWLCQMAGCLFVERRNKVNIHNEISEIREGLQLGLNVAIFPEATSTNGEQVLRFRRPLFVAAIDAGRPVIPFCLNYRLVGGQRIDRRLADKVMWYGDMAFVPHLWALASSGGVDVDLIFLPPIATELAMDPVALAARSQAVVESVFVPVPKDLAIRAPNF